VKSDEQRLLELIFSGEDFLPDLSEEQRQIIDGMQAYLDRVFQAAQLSPEQVAKIASVALVEGLRLGAAKRRKSATD
jgi:hypothetical protein